MIGNTNPSLGDTTVPFPDDTAAIVPSPWCECDRCPSCGKPRAERPAPFAPSWPQYPGTSPRQPYYGPWWGIPTYPTPLVTRTTTT